jgi:hypothetical protein
MRKPNETVTSKLLALAGALFLVVGCNPSDPVSPDGTQPSVGGKADGEEEAPPPEVPDISGAYAVRVKSVIKSRTLSTGETSTSTVTVYALATVTQDGADVSLSLKTCRAILPQVSGYQPEIKDSVMQKLTPTKTTGTVSKDDEGTVSLTTKTAAVLAGVKLTNPTTDSIPTSGSSSKVIDQDQDGYPGVSILISGFKVYGALRVLFALDGTRDGTELSGEANISQDFVIYGDNVPFVDVASSVAAAAEDSEIVSQTDSFRMVLLDDDEPRCSLVLQSGVFN